MPSPLKAKSNTIGMLTTVAYCENGNFLRKYALFSLVFPIPI